MTDSFTHSVPGIRDGNQMVVGGREVSREVVARSLENNEIVMLVPGGQHEIFTSRSFSPKVVIKLNSESCFKFLTISFDLQTYH